MSGDVVYSKKREEEYFYSIPSNSLKEIIFSGHIEEEAKNKILKSIDKRKDKPIIKEACLSNTEYKVKIN